MGKGKIDEAITTTMDTAVTAYSSDYADSTTELKYQCDWNKWHGIYKDIPFLAALINAKAFWTVGKGYTDGPSYLKKIRGNGKQTFNSILYNAVKTYTIGGDFFAEIMKDGSRLINLKPLNPETIKIKASQKGIITAYEQWNDTEMINRWNPDEMFHLPWDSTADQIHGNGTIEKLQSSTQAYKEAKADLRIVFHRYVKPLLISHVDTDDETEILAYKNKLDRAVEDGENLVLPYDTLKNMERMSIPQHSTLDPMIWITNLERDFIIAENCPAVVIGTTEEKDTEASAKILYLSWQQVVEWNQMFLEEQILAQLGIKIKLEFPASIEPALQSDQSKARKINNMESGIGAGSGGTK